VLRDYKMTDLRCTVRISFTLDTKITIMPVPTRSGQEVSRPRGKPIRHSLISIYRGSPLMGRQSIASKDSVSCMAVALLTCLSTVDVRTGSCLLRSLRVYLRTGESSSGIDRSNLM
jgi:hypothetical protein